MASSSTWTESMYSRWSTMPTTSMPAVVAGPAHALTRWSVAPVASARSAACCDGHLRPGGEIGSDDDALHR